MTFTPEQMKAIGYVAKQNNWQMSLSTVPVVFFVDRRTGGLVKRHIKYVLEEYRNSPEYKLESPVRTPTHR